MMISNSKGTHLEELVRLFDRNPHKVVFASPFLAENIIEILSHLNFNRVSDFELVTTFKPKDPEQLIKPYVLRDLFEYLNSKYPGTTIKVHVDNGLHGKLYLFSYPDSQELIVSSANFTKNGLENNHEWGIKTHDCDLIEQIIGDLFDCIEYREVTYLQIKKACVFADFYRKDNPSWILKPKIHSDILMRVYSSDDDNNSNPQYFLKPVGYTDEPIRLEDKEDFSGLHQNLHFSKKKPKGVRKGDVIITTAVGAGALLSYFKVTGGLNKATEEEIQHESWKQRWPWYLEGKNQSQGFGKNWWKYNLRRKDLLNEFLEKYPGIPVTFAGGYGLGTLNMGNDKVRITPEFGEFLISKIIECEEAGLV